MAYKIVNACYGCSRCKHCGKDHEEWLVCDICDDENKEVWEYDNSVYCADCLLQELIKDGIIRQDGKECIYNGEQYGLDDLLCVLADDDYIIKRS